MGVKTSIELTSVSKGGQLLLRQPRWADYEAWASLRQNSREHLAPWEAKWSEDHLSRRGYRQRLSVLKKLAASESAFSFHIFKNPGERLIGACNLTHITRSVSQNAKIGYWLGEGFAGHGHGRVAVTRLCSFAFDTLGLHRLEAAVRPDNERSIALLEALDFQSEGLARGYLKIDGQWHDHIIYAKLSSD